VALAALVAATAGAAAGAGAAVAQEVLDARSAQRLLFNPARAELIVTPLPSMGAAEAEAFRAVADQLVRQVPYYGAIAISPDEGVNALATVAAGNFHSREAAAAAAVAECNGKRAGGAAPCAVVAEVLPRGWEQRAFQLSAGATAAFRADYRRGRGEKAFAISDGSGGFGIGRGVGAATAALAACNAAGEVEDCRVAIQD
jgi:hypothetical protein